MARRTISREKQEWATGPILSAIAFCFLFSFACGSGLEPEDERRQGLLEEQFGERYEFDLIDEDLVIATSKIDVNPSRDEAARIFETFFFNQNKEKRDTPFTTLCVYGKDIFRYAVQYDVNTRQLRYGERNWCGG